MIKVGIIGPTNILKLSKLTRKPKKFLLEKAQLIGKILTEMNLERNQIGFGLTTM